MSLSKNEAADVLDAHLEDMLTALSLRGWDTTVQLTTMPNGVGGSCSAQPGYESAYIEIDPAKLDRNTLMRVIRHELFHIPHNQFEIYRSAVNQVVHEDAKLVLEESYLNACEMLVRFLENIFDGLGLTPKKLAAIGNKQRRAALGATAAHNRRKRGSNPRPATTKRKKATK